MDQKVHEILVGAEESLAKLSGEYASSRNYDRAATVLDIARAIGALSDKWSRAIGGHAQEIGVGVAAGQGQPSAADAATFKRKRGRRSEYPKFYGREDWLIKVGYSKSEGEYEHKAPKAVLFSLVEALVKASRKSRQFSMNDVLPLTTGDGSEIPSYQPYLCLNWLRECGLVEQHGRQGYSIPGTSEWRAEVQARWERLPAQPNGE